MVLSLPSLPLPFPFFPPSLLSLSCVCVCVHKCACHSPGVEVREQLSGAVPLLSPGSGDQTHLVRLAQQTLASLAILLALW